MHAGSNFVGFVCNPFYERLYQDQYPDEVAGLVLVDPTHEDRRFLMFKGKSVTIASLTAEQRRSIIPPGPVKGPAEISSDRSAE